ncbi:hypothetical protein MTR67_002926 [Solanum verrucosum]|uniref:Uncharacterized protein n=1 Tax=Solanum verrucosum TaxID=315347 RepID=A0AAF0PRR7_SOLVR|nr:hypothetical protein MTR67_002926 [Solanum verrucosum]
MVPIENLMFWYSYYATTSFSNAGPTVPSWPDFGLCKHGIIVLGSPASLVPEQVPSRVLRLERAPPIEPNIEFEHIQHQSDNLGPAKHPPRFVVTLLLYDTLARTFSFMDNMSQRQEATSSGGLSCSQSHGREFSGASDQLVQTSQGSHLGYSSYVNSSGSVESSQRILTLRMTCIPPLVWTGIDNHMLKGVVYFITTQRLVGKGCLSHLAYVCDTSADTYPLELVFMVREFSDVFSINLPGVPPDRKINLLIDVEPEM